MAKPWRLRQTCGVRLFALRCGHKVGFTGFTFLCGYDNVSGTGQAVWCRVAGVNPRMAEVVVSDLRDLRVTDDARSGKRKTAGIPQVVKRLRGIHGSPRVKQARRKRAVRCLMRIVDECSIRSA